jgi:GNAT superfamily N-acetyltransferase
VGVADRPMLIAQESGGAVGFLSYELLTPATVEIYCMAVLPGHHRRGLGKALFAPLPGIARDLGARFLLVKTLGPSDPDASYARTRAFYAAMGFAPLAEFPEIWGSDNPCLLMVRAV